MSEPTKRLTLTDAHRMQHELALAQAQRGLEPYASASVETTAKMEPKPDVKVGAAVGCDYEELEAHALRVTRLAAMAWRVAMEESAGRVATEEAPF